MKKIFCFILCVLIVILMTACNMETNEGSTTENTDEPAQPHGQTGESKTDIGGVTSDITTTETLELNNDVTETETLELNNDVTETEANTEDSTGDVDILQLNSKFITELYGKTENVIFNDLVNRKILPVNTEIYVPEYIDESATQTIKMEILGTEYTLSYEMSYIDPYCGISTHSYLIDGSETSRVVFNAQTGEIIKWIGLPFTKKPSTEKESIEFIRSTLLELTDGAIDIAQYEYKCRTHVYTSSDKGMRSHSVEGYKTEAAKNERISDYTFEFSRYLGKLRHPEYVSVNIWADGFRIDINWPEYEQEDLKTFAGCMNEIEEQVLNYIQLGLKDRDILKNSNITGHRLMVKDGIPYVITTVELCIFESELSKGEYTTSVTIITAFSKDISDILPVVPSPEDTTGIKDEEQEPAETDETTIDNPTSSRDPWDTDISWDSEYIDEPCTEVSVP